jgi:hypothetical protein
LTITEAGEVGEKAMEEFVSSHFGPLAGYAQLYLYHFWRNHPPNPRMAVIYNFKRKNYILYILSEWANPQK